MKVTASNNEAHYILANSAIPGATPLAWKNKNRCRQTDFKCDTHCFGAVAHFRNNSIMFQFNVAPVDG